MTGKLCVQLHLCTSPLIRFGLSSLRHKNYNKKKNLFFCPISNPYKTTFHYTKYGPHRINTNVWLVASSQFSRFSNKSFWHHTHSGWVLPNGLYYCRVKTPQASQSITVTGRLQAKARPLRISPRVHNGSFQIYRLLHKLNHGCHIETNFLCRICTTE